jgi:serine/threonine protein kinase
MLSTKTFLKNGRYRLDRRISSGAAASLYVALDLIANQPVAIVKIDAEDLSAIGLGSAIDRPQHDGLLKFSDQFSDGPNSYLVSEPLSAAPPEAQTEVDRLFERLKAVLLAIGELRSSLPSLGPIEISPETFLTAADNKLKLLWAYPAEVVGSQHSLDSPYLALEQVWDRLDHINQKAIYRSYDQQSLSLLESPPDMRTDLYSVGAVFYKLLTGVAPGSAVERSIEMIDLRVDPLTAPAKIRPDVDAESSAYVMRLLELRRERRFDSIEKAIAALPTIRPTLAASAVSVVDQLEDFELLEIPDIVTAVVPAGRSPQTADGLITPRENDALPPLPPVLEKTREAFAGQQAEHRPTVAQTRDESVFTSGLLSITEDEPAARGWRPAKMIAAFACGAAVLGGVGWAVLNFNGSPPSPAAVLAETPPATEKPLQSTPDPVAQATPPAAETTVEQPSEQTPVNSENPERPRLQVAATKQQKPLDKKVQPSTEPKPKKKLTVDDLINDN